MGRAVAFNIEANGLQPKEIWCVTCTDVDTGAVDVFRRPDLCPEPFVAYWGGVACGIGHNIINYDLAVLAKLVDGFVYPDKYVDTLVVSRLLNYSRAGGHSLESWAGTLGLPKGKQPPWEAYSEDLVTHCLENVSVTLALYKTFLPYLNSPRWQAPIETELFCATVLQQTHENGFHFSVDRAVDLRYNILEELGHLDTELLTAFPPKVRCIREIRPRLTKFGTLNRNDFRWAGSELSHFNGGPFSLIEYEDFNPGSPSQIVERLNEAGWKPTERTKGYQIAAREKNQEKLKKFSQTGWMVSETNLNTLPSIENHKDWLDHWLIKLPPKDEQVIELTTLVQKKTGEDKHGRLTLPIPELLKTKCSGTTTKYLSKIMTEWLPSETDVVTFVESQKNWWSITVTPTGTFVDCSATNAIRGWDGLKDSNKLQQIILKLQAATKLALRITLASRARTLTEWIDAYNPTTGCVHGTINVLGAWTHRCSHVKPNTGNIPTPQPLDKTSTFLKKRANEIDSILRTYWCAAPGSYLVGVDAEGIQLRVLAHYINDPRFTKAVTEGNKDEGTDPHSLNKLALGEACQSRADAKTFIYAWLLGAGVGKVAQILGCSNHEARQACDDFVQFYPGLQIVKEDRIPRDAHRGYFEGFDGRYVSIFGDDEGSRRHFCLAGYLQNGEVVVVKRAIQLWYPRLVKERIPFELVNFVHDEFVTQVNADRACADYVADIQADAIRQAGLDLNLLCPMAGSKNVGYNWKEVH